MKRISKVQRKLLENNRKTICFTRQSLFSRRSLSPSRLFKEDSKYTFIHIAG